MSTASPTEDSAGLLAGRYRVGELIARGGMASVHQGLDERLDRVVALKIMHPHLADDDALRRRFRREARSVARLTHRNIVGVFDQGEDGQSVYLAMELIEGTTLRGVLKQEGALPLRRALTLTAGILRALQAAHGADIIHRDIKPENILLTSADDVKVADFGLARVVGAATASHTGAILGTVAYVSPEVVMRGHSDARSDLYSLGILLYEMLTGVQPFRGEQPVHIAFQHVHEDVPAPSARVSTIPPGVDALVTWLAARSSSSRPSSAADALRSVEELLASLPAAALDAPPQTAALADTGEIPQLTSELDIDAALDKAPAESFLARAAASLRSVDPPDGPAHSRTAAASPSAASIDAEGMPEPSLVHRPEHAVPPGRHLADANRAHRGGLVPILSALVLLALLSTGLVTGWRWYAFDGPGGDRVVPAVAGLPLDDAERALEREQLSVRTENRFHDSVPAGEVIASEPDSGAEVKRADPVRLIVSRGVETFPVPTVQGATREEAESTLREAGFVMVEDDARHSETEPEGTVLSQSSEASAMPAGSAVHVVVSAGREPLPVPDQAGGGQGEATAVLEDAGFTVKVTEAHSATVPAGSVISQTPASGTLHRGDEVQIVISKGPEMVTVPDVTDMPENEAVAAIHAAGLQSEVTYRSTDGPRLGRVLTQSAAGGSQAAKGTTVTLTIV